LIDIIQSEIISFLWFPIKYMGYNMTLSNILTTIGIVVGLIFTAFIGYLYAHRVKFKFIIFDIMPLFDSITRNMNKLNILYNGENINKGLFLLKGVIINNGNTDISKKMLFKPFTLELPDAYQWMDVQFLTNIDEGINAEYAIDNNHLSLSWDLLKKGEFIAFFILLQFKNTEGIPSPDEIFNTLKNSHRIENLSKKIKNFKAITKEERKKESKYLRAIAIILLFIAALFCSFEFIPINRIFGFPDEKELKPEDFQYDPPNTYGIIPRFDNIRKAVFDFDFKRHMFIFQFLDDPKHLTYECEMEKFKKNYLLVNYHPQIVRTYGFSWSSYISPITILGSLGILMLIFNFYRGYKFRKITNIVNSRRN
jgi:hypothetical protein